jgi:hypothetical protein
VGVLTCTKREWANLELWKTLNITALTITAHENMMFDLANKNLHDIQSHQPIILVSC